MVARSAPLAIVLSWIARTSAQCFPIPSTLPNCLPFARYDVLAPTTAASTIGVEVNYVDQLATANRPYIKPGSVVELNARLVFYNLTSFQNTVNQPPPQFFYAGFVFNRTFTYTGKSRLNFPNEGGTDGKAAINAPYNENCFSTNIGASTLLAGPTAQPNLGLQETVYWAIPLNSAPLIYDKVLQFFAYVKIPGELPELSQGLSSFFYSEQEPTTPRAALRCAPQFSPTATQFSISHFHPHPTKQPTQYPPGFNGQNNFPHGFGKNFQKAVWEDKMNNKYNDKYKNDYYGEEENGYYESPPSYNGNPKVGKSKGKRRLNKGKKSEDPVTA